MERRIFEGDLLKFVGTAWGLLNPEASFQENWHHQLIAEYLMLAARGSVRRLIINIPPRFTKSTMATIAWPCWVWAQQPSTSWIFGSHNADLATDHSLDRRTIMSSQWYKDHWPEVQFAVDQNLKTQYQNTARGTMVSTSVGASVMGLNADYIVIDDPHDPERVLSEPVREQALRWYDQQLSTRLNDPKTGVIVLIMQRLHQADLTGHVKEHGGWTHLTLPFEAVRDETITFPLSGRTLHRTKGDLLHPERFGADWLARARPILGSWGVAGQLQQDPVPEGGGIFKRDWWHFWGAPCPKCGVTHGLPSRFDEIVQSWDMSFKDTEGADFVSGQAWGRRGGDFFLLHRVSDRMNLPATIAAVEAFDAQVRSRWPEGMLKLVEDKANGPAVLATLTHRLPGLLAVDPAGGKVARAQAVSPIVEAGNAYLPSPTVAPWCGDMFEQLAAFPKGAHDDDVDAMTQALRRLAGYGLPGEGFLRYLGETVAEQEKALVTTEVILR
jgi:predicted phage terminase large subunit-like protein